VFESNSPSKVLGRMLYRVGLRLSHKVFVLNKYNEQKLLEEHFVSPKKLILLTGGEGVNLTKYPF